MLAVSAHGPGMAGDQAPQDSEVFIAPHACYCVPTEPGHTVKAPGKQCWPVKLQATLNEGVQVRLLDMISEQKWRHGIKGRGQQCLELKTGARF